MPNNNIAFARNYTSVIDEVYQRASVSGVLNSGHRMVRAEHNAKEILIPKISVTGLGDYTRNVGYETGAITYEFKTKTFNLLPNSGETPILTGWATSPASDRCATRSAPARSRRSTSEASTPRTGRTCSTASLGAASSRRT